MKKILKVATYNIAHGLNYNGKAYSQNMPVDLSNTANAIKEVDADIVGLNEVYDSGIEELVNQAKKLAQYAGFSDYVFGQSILINLQGVLSAYGNAFLSKYKIIKSEVIKVPSPKLGERGCNGYYEDRSVLHVVIDCGVNVSVYVTHFGLNDDEKQPMVKTLINLIDNDSLPVILMGDFNAEPNDEILKPIYDRLTSCAKEVGNTQFTYSTCKPEITIDYVFVSKYFKIKEFEVVNTLVSDHFPCKAVLQLEI